MDSVTTVEELKQLIKRFVEEREWQDYHDPKNLSMNIAGEAAELMEIFEWVRSDEANKALEERRSEVENEIADVAFGVINFCMRHNIDLSEALNRKIHINEKKYPIEKAKGRAIKYDKLKDQ